MGLSGMSGESKKTVLVVDDEEDIRHLVSQILELEGYDVLRAEHGQDGLNRVAERMPDLILLDMKMPVMNGPDFAQRFRAQYGPVVPIVVITAAASARKSAKDINAEGYIGKPFDLEVLVTTVHKHLNGRASNGQTPASPAPPP